MTKITVLLAKFFLTKTALLNDGGQLSPVEIKTRDYFIKILEELEKDVLTLEAEKAGDVVLGDGELEFDGVEKSWHMPMYRKEAFSCFGKKGQLIFREEKCL